MSEEPKLQSFKELGLSFGQVLTLLPKPGEKDVVFDCELIGCLHDESIIIGPPESGVLPRLVEGQRVVIRTKLAGGVALFPTVVLFVSEVPTVMIYLDYPRDIKFKQVRSAFRVSVNQAVLGSNLNDSSLSAVAGRMVDISSTGARLEMFSELGIVGHEVELKGKFQVGSVQRLVSIRTVIRSRQCDNDRWFYGVEFCEGDEDKLLVLMGYTFHAMAFGQVQSVR